MRNHPNSPRFADLLPRRAIRLFSLAFALVATGGLVALAAGGIEPVPHRTAAAAPAADPIPTLPTVVVRPEPEIPTLATVTVRAGAAAEADALPARRARALPVHAVTSFASTGSAGTGFGMPYYSFGKPLHSGTEE